MSFLTEPEPPRGEATVVQPGIRRVVAENPSVMTYWGTNTYLINSPGGVLVLDPGPDDPSHVRNVLAAAGAPVVGIMLTHTHQDHLGALFALREATGAPTYGFHSPADPRFTPDVALGAGERVGAWQAVHTPGHAPDHLCFAGPDGVLFSGDHVMGWSSTVVGPPLGDMSEYVARLQMLLERDDRLYLPGHGPGLSEPRRFVRDLLEHRMAREAAIREALRAGPTTARALMEQIYSQVHPSLRRAAERNVVAHLGKLRAEGAALESGGEWRLTEG